MGANRIGMDRMITSDALARLEAQVERCEDVVKRTARDGYFDPPMTEADVLASAATHVELSDLKALLAERKALVEALERAKDAAEDMIDMASEMAESVGSTVEGDCSGGAEVCAEGLCESGCLVARVSLARDGIRRAAAVLGGGETK